MRGASRASLAEARERLWASDVGEHAGQLGDELFGVAGVLDREPRFCRMLSDPSRPADAKAALAETVLRGKVSAATLEVVTGLARSHWSAPRDLADAAEQLAVLAIVEGADAEGTLDELEDELFRFGRIVDAEPDLRVALSSPFVDPERKQQLLDALLAGQVTPSALRLITEAAFHPRGRSLDRSLGEYAGLAAQRRERLVAEVHVAAELSEEQRGRLAAALAAAYGHDVHLNVVLDPEVIGGMSVRIADELIDGSLATRLAALRRRLAA
ncbi:MAG TPA: F0F1 ATP synthase subunit delta [Streptosporangiaceae bacterium]|nr:F0F1 ATP synthase subunit delta [Streptosporangiaceae bacterium]